jgi:hypothetical protein
MDQQSIEAIRQSIASNVRQVEFLSVVMLCLVACVAAWVSVAIWRGVQRDQATRRVCDRLAQERDPEGWARRQADKALESALIAEELAAMRRASWYGRLLRWRRPTDQAQA